MKNTKLVCIGANEIGYGEGISQEEDWGLDDERPDLISSTELI